MKPSAKILVVTFALPGMVCLTAAEQIPLRGRALYQELINNRDLVKFEGLSRVSWTPCGNYYYVFDKTRRTFLKYHPLTGQSEPLLDDDAIIQGYNTLTGQKSEELPFQDFEFMPDGKTLRFKSGSRVFLFDTADGSMTSGVPEPEIVGVRGRVYSEVFSPDLKFRAYTRDYDLFVKDEEENEYRLTQDGSSDLRNAFPDWVYAEEFGQYDAFWWSPDSKKIAFMQFDEHPVTKYPIVHDVNPFPEFELQSYPKAGANNPIVRLFIADIASRKLTLIDSGLETNVYLYRGQWTPDGREFTYRRLNRLQNRIELWAADPHSGKSRLVLSDEDPCYIDEGVQLLFLQDGSFLWTSERSGWNEIYHYDLQGRLIRQVSDVKLPIGRILSVEHADGWVYFSGYRNRGLEGHLFRIRVDGSGLEQLTREPGSHFIEISPGASYYTDTFSSFAEPRRVTLHASDGKKIRELGHSVISPEFLALRLIEPESFIFKSADGKHTLDGMLFKPAHFDSRGTYPLILSVYGGPGSKQIFNRYVMNDRNQALAQLGFMVASVDHRGVSRRGKNFQNLMYMNLGEIELDDHAAAVAFLTSRSTIDAERVGITGHSYGGYLTCLALLKRPDVFHVGVAGAPVTDWRNYDTIYTERYMRRPQDNPEGYRTASCMTYAKDLAGNLAIHHGAVDDNVHPGNSVQLLQALLQHNKTFDFHLYPEQRHGIRFQRYGDARIEFFIRHLKPDVQ